MNALYDVQVEHLRAAPVRHQIHHRGYLWLVDVDRLPQLPRGLRSLARFEARDHLGAPDRSIRANVEDFLTAHGVRVDGGRIKMLSQARALGYVFNPLTLFWCHDHDGQLAAVVAEVHNTYGARHCYLLRPDDAGRAEVAKDFYVSPFYPVDGYYRMSVPEPGERLAVTITLHRPHDRPFVASVRGVRRRATMPALVRAALRYPLSTWMTRAMIMRHGIALYRKGLPVQSRAKNAEEKPVPSGRPPRPSKSSATVRSASRRAAWPWARSPL